MPKSNYQQHDDRKNHRQEGGNKIMGIENIDGKKRPCISLQISLNNFVVSLIL